MRSSLQSSRREADKMFSSTSAAQLACCAQAAAATEQASRQTPDETEITEGVFEGPMRRWSLDTQSLEENGMVASNEPSVADQGFGLGAGSASGISAVASQVLQR
jgi:hypothetical protein